LQLPLIGLVGVFLPSTTLNHHASPTFGGKYVLIPDGANLRLHSLKLTANSHPENRPKHAKRETHRMQMFWIFRGELFCSFSGRVDFYQGIVDLPTSNSLFPKIVVPQNGWFITYKTQLKWMIWGTTIFGNIQLHPFFPVLFTR